MSYSVPRTAAMPTPGPPPPPPAVATLAPFSLLHQRYVVLYLLTHDVCMFAFSRTHSQKTRNDASRVAHGGDGKAAQGNGGGGYAATGMTSESPYFGPSSVHYGGRDFFYGAGHGQQDHRSHSETIPPPKKEDNKQQPDGSAATRGDWWQGTAAITIIIISRISLLLTERLYIQLIDVAIHRSIKPNCIQHI
ncbi:hypothetical protein EJB05_13571, partial [Eragrostis curvula]